MKIFLDTANVESIKAWVATGLIDGVTTNPTLLSKEGGDVTSMVKDICAIMGNRPVSVEVTQTDPARVYEQAKEIAAIAPNVVVKIPCHVDYFPTIKKLVDEGLILNITLVFTLLQSLFMCKLGVKYISPFVGRLDDTDVDGMEVVAGIRDMIDEYGFNTQLLVASIRSVSHVHDAVRAGADAATIPVAVLEKAVSHALTDKGMTQFLEDWKKLGITRFP